MNKFFYLNEMRVNVELVGGDLVKSLAHSQHAACHFRLMTKNADFKVLRYLHFLTFQVEKELWGGWEYRVQKMIRTRREEDNKDTRGSLHNMISINKQNCIAFHSFWTLFSYNWAGNIQRRVCFGPMRGFLSRLHGRHWQPFPASKSQVLFTI